MNEYEPNYEEVAAWNDQCSKCETVYQLNQDTAVFKYFEKQPECSFLVCQCPNCEHMCQIYDDSVDVWGAEARGITINDTDEYASPEHYQGWLKLKGIELPKEYELTMRHEALVKKFGETISAMSSLAPDLFWDEISSPQPRQTMASRWV